ncbi:MAG: cobalt-precorrin-5B (C(1))-methyltransferase CbiD [Firmicutes bacterium]|nr:cobalt-precorrin-5B (C(1))-methyltransferase CbiD [Bacillota bacterium]
MNELEKMRLREGFTTGAAAAAAARAAALLLLRGERCGTVRVHNPDGLPIDIPVARVEKSGNKAVATVVKDGGDDPDATHGLEIVAAVCPSRGGLTLAGGTGVGTVTRPGLAIPPGEPAINPVPRRMITDAVAGLLAPGEGLSVTISVPRGAEVASRTLNPRLGITGGISILGTTGIVRPMSEEAFKNSLIPLVDLAVAAGFRKLVLTPGRLGIRFAVQQYGFPSDAVVEMSNFTGFMLEVCADRGIHSVLLWGHHGKIVKVAAGIFHTHSRVADGRREVIAAYAASAGATAEIVRSVLRANTAEEALEILKKNGLAEVYNLLAARASERAAEYTRGRLKVGTVLLGLDGSIVGLDETAVVIGRELGWKR